MDEIKSVQGGARIPPLLSWDQLSTALNGKRPVLFLDYDGTLTPIAARPDLANLSGSTRGLVSELAGRMPVAILTGRDIDDVRQKVRLDELVYVGSHGFDVAGPGIEGSPDVTDDVTRGQIDRIGQEVETRLSAVPGVILENKRFSVAVHYRNVAESEVSAMLNHVHQIAERETALRLAEGKKLIEIRPDVEWDKGTALLWVLQALDLDHESVLPVFFGDDVTDEDGFRALRSASKGHGVVVCDPPRPSWAHSRLPDPAAVITVLRELLVWAERAS